LAESRQATEGGDMAVTDFRIVLVELARALRQLHRALVDCVSGQYQREYGPVPGAGGLLHLLPMFRIARGCILCPN
jgi:hypothetical protein